MKLMIAPWWMALSLFFVHSALKCFSIPFRVSGAADFWIITVAAENYLSYHFVCYAAHWGLLIGVQRPNKLNECCGMTLVRLFSFIVSVREERKKGLSIQSTLTKSNLKPSKFSRAHFQSFVFLSNAFMISFPSLLCISIGALQSWT